MTQGSDRSDRLRILVLSRNYPNNVMDVLGLWVRGPVRELAKTHDVKVVAPTPYCPPIPGLPASYSRFRQVQRRHWDGGIESIHPRLIVGPGGALFAIDWWLYLAAVGRAVRRLRQEFPFDVIHAQFTYPDGVAAVRLGRQYGVPVVITEQNSWLPWMNEHPGVRRRSIEAVRRCDRHISISAAVRRSVERFVTGADNLTVIPNGLDPVEFPLQPRVEARDPTQLLFVGAVRPVKGVDLLIRALRLLVDGGRAVRLLIVGEAYYDRYRQEEVRLKQLASELGLADRVRFVGKQLPPELGDTMGRSAVLVLPSRIEALGMVLVEALACGTPVVATRSGGPEEFVDDEVGVLVPVEDPQALARAVAHVLDHRGRYDPARLRARALERFALSSVSERLTQVYHEVVHPYRRAAAPRGHRIVGSAAQA